MKKLIKFLDKYFIDICIFMMIIYLMTLLFHAVWMHNKGEIFSHTCYVFCWIIWYSIHRRNMKGIHERHALKMMCVGLMTALEDKKPEQNNPEMKVPSWRICKAGHAFKSDAIVVGLGDDKDPRLVRCAVNDSKYILVKDLLNQLPTIEAKDASK